MKPYIPIYLMSLIPALLWAQDGETETKAAWKELPGYAIYVSEQSDTEVLVKPYVKRQGNVLRIEAPETSGTLQVLQIRNPGVTSSAYAIIGEVRYEEMGKGSYLESWNHLGANEETKSEKTAFFSRTLAESGPMGNLQGDSAWRPLELPAYVNDKSGRTPEMLELNLHFGKGGGGWVELRGLDVIELSEAAVSGGNRIDIVSTVLGAGGGVAFIVLLWTFLRQRQIRELRRIQAADMMRG